MVAMTIYGLALEEKGQAPIILLKDEKHQRALPIWIGAMEAMSISMALKSVPFPRPMTHDLLLNAITSLGGSLEAVEVTDIVEGTFYAELVVRQGEEIVRIDSRPSDGIALAVRAGAEVRVDEKVISKAGMPLESIAEKVISSSDADQWSDLLEGLSEDDIKYKM